MNKIKLLMLGPGIGHNILPWLEFMNELKDYDITFLCSSFHFKENEFKNIKIVQQSLKIKHIFNIRNIFKDDKFDIFFIQGGNSSLNTLLFVLLIYSKISILNIWGESILDRSIHGSIRDRFSYYFLFKKINYILFSWYGTLQKFEKIYPKLQNKTWLLFLGLSKTWFSKEVDPPSSFVQNLLSSLPAEKRICIWPKSLIYGNRFDLVIRALKKLSENNPELVKKFLLLIWGGNNEDPPYRAEIESFIKENNLENIIEIIDHPFLEFSDMVHVMNRSDFYINFGNTDQLTNTILEAMLFEKPLAISDIQPYRLLNEKLNLNMKLIPNDVENISNAFKELITGTFENDADIFKKRKQFVYDYFQIEKEMQELFLIRIPKLIKK